MNRREFLGGAVSIPALSVSSFSGLTQSEHDLPLVVEFEKPEFKVRGFEIHSRRMWQWKSIATAFSFMERLKMNMLVFHQDDITDTVVWPDKYFPENLRDSRWPVRGSNIQNAQEYLRNVASEARKRQITFFFEVCEIWYPDGLIELHPEVMDAKGAICPTHPFWWEFLRTKYTELFDTIPDLAGIIVSAGTRESKVSIAANKCSCARCDDYSPLEWYTKLISAMYDPIRSRGKTLVVRDFAYTKAEQNLVVDACTRLSSDIVVSLKNTPHDFYPTFPNNPRIGQVGAHPQWIEFDCWGQFYGLGLFPCSIAEDMQHRLSYCRAKGATGALFRTDLESRTEESVFNSFNLLNLVSGALLSQRTTQDMEGPYKAWLQIGLFDALIPESLEPPAVAIPSKHLSHVISFMRASWSVMEKTFYVRGFLFNRGSGMFVPNVDSAFFYMQVLHGRDDWEPGASKRIEPTEQNIAAIIAEKDAAMVEVQQLGSILQIDSLPISPQFKEHLKTILSLYIEYVRGIRLCAIGCFRTKQTLVFQRAADAQLAMQSADELQQYRIATARLLDDKYFPHYVYHAFALDNIDSLVMDIRKICSPLVPS